MLRDQSLIPLSRQHQHALALCVRIDRASPVAAGDLEKWQAEITEHFQTEIGVHFAAEEQVLFPAALKVQELAPLVDELLAEHASLRHQFSAAEARTMSPDDVLRFARQLSNHIRKEERQLFEVLQQRMSKEKLLSLGGQLENGLKDAAQACFRPAASKE